MRIVVYQFSCIAVWLTSTVEADRLLRLATICAHIAYFDFSLGESRCTFLLRLCQHSAQRFDVFAWSFIQLVDANTHIHTAKRKGRDMNSCACLVCRLIICYVCWVLDSLTYRQSCLAHRWTTLAHELNSHPLIINQKKKKNCINIFNTFSFCVFNLSFECATRQKRSLSSLFILILCLCTRRHIF